MLAAQMAEVHVSGSNSAADVSSETSVTETSFASESEGPPCTPIGKTITKVAQFGSCSRTSHGKIKLFVATEYSGACRALQVSETDSWKTVCSMIQKKFNVPIFYLYYIDDDGDKVEVDDEDAFEDFKEVSASRKHKLTAVTPLSPGCDVTNTSNYEGICPEGVLERFTHSIHNVYSVTDESQVGTVSCCSLSSDKSAILTGGSDNKLRLWKNASCIATMNHSSEVISCDLSNTSQLAASGCSDGTISLWDLRPQQQQPSKTARRLIASKAMTTKVTSIKFSPDSFVLAVACHQRPVRIMSLQFIGLHTLPGTDSSIDMTFGNSAGSALFCTGSKKLQLWHYKCGKSIGTLTDSNKSVDEQPCRSCVFSQDDRLLATTSGCGILVWNTSTKSLVRRLVNGDSIFRSVTFTLNDKIVASAASGDITVWNPTGNNIIGKKTAHEGSFIIDAVEDIVVSAAAGKVSLWRVSQSE